MNETRRYVVANAKIQFFCPHHAPPGRTKIANSGTEKATCTACGAYGYTPAPYNDGSNSSNTTEAPSSADKMKETT